MRSAPLSLLLAASALSCSEGGPSPDLGSMRVDVLVRDLVGEGAFWDGATSHPDLAPHIGVIEPAVHHSRDGAGNPSLVLAPPGEATFTVRPEDGPCVLRGRAGVDVMVVRFLNEHTPRFSFDFEAAVGGETVWSASVDVVAGAVPIGSDWVDLGGADGIQVAAGDVVTLRTFARDGEGRRIVPPVPVLAGFGRLRLERTGLVPRRPSSPGRPNVVLVVMDTLRADRLSTYGYERPTSPSLDRLAARGTLFTRASDTSSWTWPSSASLLTGLLPAEHGVEDKSACFLASSITTLAEALQAEGITTAAWSGNPLISPTRNFDQGFERFDYPPEEFRKTEAFFGDVEAWLAENAGRRFFLYLQLTEPHAPYRALPEARRRLAPDVPADYDLERYGRHSLALLRGEGHGPHGELETERVVPAEEQRWYSELYDACVASGDAWLGRLLDVLERLGLEDETVVCFTNDHGEELFDRGLMNHGQSLHPELVHAPLVLAGPGVPAGARVDVPVSNRHVAPTLAALAGVPFRGPVDPQDLVALVRRPAAAPAALLLSTRNGWWNGRRGVTIHALRKGDLVLHLCPEGAPWGAPEDERPGEVRLYDLAADPHEREDLTAREPERAASLRAELEGALQELELRRSVPSFRAGEATLELLRRVGYVGEER